MTCSPAGSSRDEPTAAKVRVSIVGEYELHPYLRGFGMGFLTAGLLSLGAWEISNSDGIWLATSISSIVCISLGITLKLVAYAR